jgi:hypothetical protein
VSKETNEIKEKIASRIPVDCGYDARKRGLEPCPHLEPTAGYERCPHKDKEVCMWQREIAKEALKVETDTLRIAIVKKKPELPLNPYRHTDLDPLWTGGNQIYGNARQDMLDAGFVQEEQIAD